MCGPMILVTVLWGSADELGGETVTTVTLKDVTKVFRDGTVAVDNVSLDVDDGEFMVLLGPSGCGKSTVLRMIAGLEDPTAGAVLLDGELANDLPPRDRKIAMVFQDFALYPHMTVGDNIGFPLRLSGVEPEPRGERVSRRGQRARHRRRARPASPASSPAASASGWRWVGRSSGGPACS